MHKVVFLDRDWVINKKIENDYVKSLDEFIYYEGIFEVLKLLSNKWFKFIIITNQQGVWKWLMTESDLGIIHDKLREDFLENDLDLLDIYICPHLVSDQCECRKPRSWMLVKAFSDFDIDKEGSFLIGDSDGDIIASSRIWLKSIKIETDCILKYKSVIFNYIEK